MPNIVYFPGYAVFSVTIKIMVKNHEFLNCARMTHVLSHMLRSFEDPQIGADFQTGV